MTVIRISQLVLLPLIFFIVSCGGGGGGGGSAPDKIFTLQYSAGAGGSVTGKLNQSVSEGNNGTTVNAIPDEGFVFNRWSDGYAKSARTDKNVKTDIKVQAQFKAEDDEGIQYTLSYTAGSGGSISGVTPQLVDEGSNGTSVTAVPDVGYHFVEWSDGSTINPRTDNTVTGNISVSASFAINSYTLSYSTGSNGSLTGTTSQNVNHGSDGTAVTAVPNTNYHFVNWSDGSTANPRTDINITSDLSVTAAFAINSYTLSYTAGSNGLLTGSASQNVNHGSNGTAIMAVPNTGYHFVEWSDGSSTNPRTDNTVIENISVTANFAINSYTLSYSAGSNGSLTGTTSQNVNHGSNGTAVTVVPDTGYHFVEWSDGSSANPRTDINVTENITVTAAFAINSYTLSYSAGSNGSLTGSTSQNVNHGSNGVEVTAVPNTGYLFDEWSDGNISNPRADTNVTQNIAVTANFILKTYTLTYSAGEGGSLTGDTEQVVNHGSNGTAVTAVPDTDYYFIQWSDGKKANPRTDTSVTKNITVTAEFSTEMPVALVTPWLEKPHSGSTLTVDVLGPTKAEISWASTGGETYDLYISRDVETDLSNYASHGAELLLGVSSPLMLDDLLAGEAVYIALVVNGVLAEWSSFSSKVWGMNNDVYAQAIGDDGTRYIGGPFSWVDTNSGAGVALATDVDIPHALAFPEVNGTIFTAVNDADGGWYIGGSFTHVAGESRPMLAHIDKLGRLTGWNPEVNGTVAAVTLDGGIIYVGGNFTVATDTNGSFPRNRLAAFDAAGNLTDWNPRVSSTSMAYWVYALASADGVIYAGGSFRAAGEDDVTRNRLAAFDAEGNLTGWNPGTNGEVFTLAVAEGVIYAGGSFTAAGGGTGTTTRNRLAAFDASGNLADWNPGVNASSVRTLTIADGVIYAGGNFTAAGGGTGTTTRNRLAAFGTDGNLTTWNPGVSGTGATVLTLAVAEGVIYAGGHFTAAGNGAGSTPRNRLAAFDASGNLTNWNPGANDLVSTLAISNGIIYAGGSFTAAGRGTGSTPRNRLAAFDASGNLTNWNPGVNGSISTLAISNGIIYAGGSFTAAGGGVGTTPRNQLAAFDESGNLTNWNPSVNGQVYAMTIEDGVIYVGGVFTAALVESENITRNRLAAFDINGNLTDWNPGASGVVRALASANGVIYAGGFFGLAGGGGTGNATRERLAAFDTVGNLTDWNPRVVGEVFTLAISDGVIYAGGQFNLAAGTGAGNATRWKLAAFDEIGNLMPWDPRVNSGTTSTIVYSVCISEGVIFAGGSFTFAGGATRQKLAAFYEDGSLAPWNPGAFGSSVRTVVVSEGTIFVGGTFTGVGGGIGTTTRSRLAAFDEDGELLDH